VAWLAAAAASKWMHSRLALQDAGVQRPGLGHVARQPEFGIGGGVQSTGAEARMTR
jgi:hypothetical protein